MYAGAKGQFIVMSRPSEKSGIAYTAGVEAGYAVTDINPLLFGSEGPFTFVAGKYKSWNHPIETSLGRVLLPNGTLLSPSVGAVPNSGSIQPGYYLSRTGLGTDPTARLDCCLTLTPPPPLGVAITLAVEVWSTATSNFTSGTYSINGDGTGTYIFPINIGGGNLGVEWDWMTFGLYANANVGGFATFSCRSYNAAATGSGTFRAPVVPYNLTFRNRQNFSALVRENATLARTCASSMLITNMTPEMYAGGELFSYLCPAENRLGYYENINEYIGGQRPYARRSNAIDGDYKYWMPQDAMDTLFHNVELVNSRSPFLICSVTTPDRTNQAFNALCVHNTEFVCDSPLFDYAVPLHDPMYWMAVAQIATLPNESANFDHKKIWATVKKVISHPATKKVLGSLLTAGLAML